MEKSRDPQSEGHFPWLSARPASWRRLWKSWRDLNVLEEWSSASPVALNPSGISTPASFSDLEPVGR